MRLKIGCDGKFYELFESKQGLTVATDPLHTARCEPRPSCCYHHHECAHAPRSAVIARYSILPPSLKESIPRIRASQTF